MRLDSLVLDHASTEITPRSVEELSMQRRILVIDHDHDFRLAVCDRLRAMGFDAAGEDSGISGLARLAREAPHVPFAGVLLELDLPSLGGMAVLSLHASDRYVPFDSDRPSTPRSQVGSQGIPCQTIGYGIVPNEVPVRL